MASLIGREMGGFLIEEEVGRGAMGVVFKAKQLSMDRHVALKFLPKRLAQDEKVVARFQREARAAGQLSHPNLVNVHDVGVVEGLHFIAMEYVDGNSIHKRVREKGPYTEKEALDIAAQVAAALKAAHARGILHRDIKPDNFLIDSSGRVRVADLGLARFQNSDKEAEVSRDGTTVGTPHYMSPEQCRGDDVDERSDIYGLGASLYVVATGHTPYDAPTAAAVMVKALTEPPRSLKQLRPSLSNSFVGLVEKLMAKDPAKRFRNAQEVLDAIERCRKGHYRPITKDQAKVENVPLVPLAEAPRYKLLLLGAAAAVVVLVAGGFLWRARNQAASQARSDGAPPATPSSSAANEDAQGAAGTVEPKNAPVGPPPKSAPKAKKEVLDLPPVLPPPAPDVPIEKPEHMAAVKKLSALKLELREKMLQDPDSAVARMEEFLKQHPGPRIANIAQEFLAQAKEVKEQLDHDWTEARQTAEKEALAGRKAKAFQVLREFAAAHGGTKQASAAAGMMAGWVTDLRSEANRMAEAGRYERAIEMLTLADLRLPEETTGALKKDLERITEEQKRHRKFVEADRKQAAEVVEKAGAAAREADSVTGKRYDFEESAKLCREAGGQMKTAVCRRELEALAGTYSRAAKVMERMRLALQDLKTVPLPGLGSFKEPGQLTGWEDRGLSFKPKDLPAQTVQWKLISGENLLQLAQVLKIASGDTPSDLLDAGALAFATGADTVAAEKLEQAVKADPSARSAVEAPLRILKPGPSAEEREAQAKQLFAEVMAAREKKDTAGATKLQRCLMAEFADTEFVQDHRKQLQELSLPRPAGPPETGAVPPDKAKTSDQPKQLAAEKADKKDEADAKKDEKKDDKQDDAAVTELKKLGWAEVAGAWTQDQRRKTAFTVTGGGMLRAPLIDAAVQVTFQSEEGASIGIYLRVVPETPGIKELRASLDEYNLVLGRGYGVHYAGGLATVYGDPSPSAYEAGTSRAALAKKPVPLKLQSLPGTPGAHTVMVSARADKLEIILDGKTWRTNDKLRAEGGVAIFVEGNAKVEPLLGR